MKKNKKLHFPILLKVILLGIITSFVAATVSIIVNYNNMINKARKDVEESAIDALEYAHGFFDNPAEDYKNLYSFNYIHDYFKVSHKSNSFSILLIIRFCSVRGGRGNRHVAK